MATSDMIQLIKDAQKFSTGGDYRGPESVQRKDYNGPESIQDPYAALNAQNAQANVRNKRQAEQVGQIAEHNKGTQKNNFFNSVDAYGISDQMSENLANQQLVQANISSNRGWFDQISKLGAAMNALATAAGNGMNGSGLHTAWNIAELQDDIGDNAIFAELSGAKNGIANSLFEAKAGNINNINQAAVNTGSNIDAITADLAAQQANLGTHDQDLFNAGALTHSNFYNENKQGPLTWDQLPEALRNPLGRTDQNVRSPAPRDSGGDNSRAGAVDKSYAQRQRDGYNRR